MPPVPKPSWFSTNITLGNVLSIIATLGAVVTVYTNLKLDVAAASQKIAVVQEQVQSLDNDNLPTRISIIENTIILNKKARDDQNAEIVKRLDGMEDAIVGLGKSVASLDATIKATSARP